MTRKQGVTKESHRLQLATIQDKLLQEMTSQTNFKKLWCANWPETGPRTASRPSQEIGRPCPSSPSSHPSQLWRPSMLLSSNCPHISSRTWATTPHLSLSPPPFSDWSWGRHWASCAALPNRNQEAWKGFRSCAPTACFGTENLLLWHLFLNLDKRNQWWDFNRYMSRQAWVLASILENLSMDDYACSSVCLGDFFTPTFWTYLWEDCYWTNIFQTVITT